jgi:hypothetical protein
VRKKADEIYDDYDKKLAALFMECCKPDGAIDNDKLREKQRPVYAERDQKVRETLPAELLEKHDSGMKIMEENQAKQRVLLDEMRKRYEELNGQLDEKIGKRPDAPRNPTR